MIYIFEERSGSCFRNRPKGCSGENRDRARSRHRDRKAGARAGAWAGGSGEVLEEVGFPIQSEGRAPSEGNGKGVAAGGRKRTKSTSVLEAGDGAGPEAHQTSRTVGQDQDQEPARTSNGGPQRTWLEPAGGEGSDV